MPEEAPVIRTTLPATSSGKNEEKTDIINFTNKNGGNKKHIAINIKERAVKFKIVFTIFIFLRYRTCLENSDA